MTNLRVLILPAGYGAYQVADILMRNGKYNIVGYLDDIKDLDEEILGSKVIGKEADLERLYEKNVFDCAIITTTKNKRRKELYDKCKKLNITMIKAIDINMGIGINVVIGEGNVICGNGCIGTCTTIGNNNFISSGPCIEHHNKIGSHITTGDNFNTSGLCEVKDLVKIGINVGLEPFVTIGKESRIASNIVLTKSIPNNSLVKKKVDYIVRSGNEVI